MTTRGYSYRKFVTLNPKRLLTNLSVITTTTIFCRNSLQLTYFIRNKNEDREVIAKKTPKNTPGRVVKR